MATELTIEPAEDGSAVVVIAPTDEDGTPLVIEDFIEASWQLCRYNRGIVIINDRSFANTNPMPSLEVVLTKEDLTLYTAREDKKRYFTFKGKYTSDLGVPMWAVAEASFDIEDLVGIPPTIG